MAEEKDDPTEELGVQLSPAERCIRVVQEVDGVYSQYKITDWEKNFLKGNTDSKWPNFTEKQEAVMQKIEAKVFDKEFADAKEAKEEEIEEGYRALDGTLHFKGKRK